MINFMFMGKFPTHFIWQLVKAVPAAMFLTNAFSSVTGGVMDCPWHLHSLSHMVPRLGRPHSSTPAQSATVKTVLRGNAPAATA